METHYIVGCILSFLTCRMEKRILLTLVTVFTLHYLQSCNGKNSKGNYLHVYNSVEEIFSQWRSIVSRSEPLPVP